MCQTNVSFPRSPKKAPQEHLGAGGHFVLLRIPPYPSSLEVCGSCCVITPIQILAFSEAPSRSPCNQVSLISPLQYFHNCVFQYCLYCIDAQSCVPLHQTSHPRSRLELASSLGALRTYPTWTSPYMTHPCVHFQIPPILCTALP